MEVVKRNMFSIVCGAVALLALLLAYYPLQGWFEQLSAKLKQSATIYADLNGIANTPHYMPILNLEATEQAQLDHFPNPANIKQGEVLVGELKQQSAKLTDIVMKLNVHTPLLPEVFPAGGSGFARSAFKNAYYRKLEEFKTMLNASSPPTNLEKQAELTRFKTELFDKRLVSVNGADNRSELDQIYRAKEQTMGWDLSLQRARDYTVYVTQRAIDPCSRDGFMPPRDDSGLPEVEAMWAAQNCLWIEEDVVKAIVASNPPRDAKSGGVENATVKRLVKLEVPKKYMTSRGEISYAIARFAGGGSGLGSYRVADLAAAAANDTSEPDLPSARIYAASATGRVSNTLYDVIHFTVVADCDANKFRDFMTNLVKDHFITILRTDFIGIDRDKEMNKGFIYGKNPVVRVAMRCEAIFFRQWTTRWMPANVRKILKVPDDASASDVR